MSTPQKILFIQTAFIGDLLLSIPTLRALRAEHVGCEISLLCRKGLGDFMRLAAVADNVIEADKTSPGEWTKITEDLKSTQWQFVYCPHQSARSLLLAQAVKATRKIGYRNWLGKFVFDQAIERPMHLPEALRQMVLLESKRTTEVFDYEPVASQNIYRQVPKLKAVPAWASMKLPALQAEKKDLIVIAPGSVWATKKWTEQGFGEVAAFYAAQGKTVQLVGNADERLICDRVRSIVLYKVPLANVSNSAGQLSLWQSAMAMAEAQLVFTNDSGAMHLAACAGTPTVSVFGPTVLEQGYRPWQSEAQVVSTDISCRPCGKHGARKCPIGTHECMKLVNPATVVLAAEKINL